CVGRNSTNKRPATLSMRESSLARRASSRCDKFFQRYSRQMLRVNRLAAAIDMMAAGTSAPTAMAAKQNPANHDGNIFTNKAGTTKLEDVTDTPAANAP